MSPPSSGLFRVDEIPGAGRGVIASEAIQERATVFRSRAPACHVIHRQYRKEVCAQCFHYDGGRHLPVRMNACGKVFCADECRVQWVAEQGQIGLAAWEALHAFVLKNNAAIANDHGLSSVEKPGRQEIALKWEEVGRLIGEGGDKGVANSSLQRKSSRAPRMNGLQKRPKVVDPDILSFLLSAGLFHLRHSNKWEVEMLALTADEQPYRSHTDLEVHCNSFLQLHALMPNELCTSLTTQVCQTAISVASHNAFGIRAGSDEGEEYLGYAVYPEASYFNHSCSPNIVKQRNGSIWEFRASRSISDGEECCITYLSGDERTLSAQERRARLTEIWGFECMCQRCKNEA